MKHFTLNTRFIPKIRCSLVTCCYVILLMMIPSLSAQTTILAVATGDINAPSTWSATGSITIPTSSTSPVDTNLWSTDIYTLKAGASGAPAANFYGGTLSVAASGTLSSNIAGAYLTLRNLILDGGRILTANNSSFTLDLQSATNTLTLNSGSIVTTSSLSGNQYIKNCSLAGSGNITIAQTGTNTNNLLNDYVEFQSTVNTNNFSGIFTVAPGNYSANPVSPAVNNGMGGTLKISAATSGTFGISIPAANSAGVLLPNGISYASNLNGKLYFTPASGNLILVSLNLGGVEVLPGTYSMTGGAGITAFTSTQLGYLDSRSTGKIIVTGVVNPPTAVAATNINGIASVSFNGNASSFTVTPYDVTASSSGTPVTGLTSPILISGLTNNHSYTFTVTATNALGVTSVPSVDSAPVLITTPGIISAIAGAISAVTNIYDAAAWPAGTILPVMGDVNVWSTSLFRLGVSTTPYTFNGGTLNVALGGVLSLNAYSSVLKLNNLTLNGGVIQASTLTTASIDLQTKTFRLNSGSLKTTSNSPSFKDLLFQNGSLAGVGTITLAQIQSGSYSYNVEFLSSVNTKGFTGKFEVAPGLSGTSVGGSLKLNAITAANASFGVNVLATDPVNGVVSNNGTYTSSLNGELYFTPGAGNTVSLVSLTLGGMDVVPGTYAYADFTAAQQTYLNPASTGTITITGAVNPPTDVIGGTSVSFADTLNNGGYAITNYTVTPYDVTTSTKGTAVSGTTSPISISGLVKSHTYTFTVTATNTVGITSAASAPSAAVVLAVPGAPIVGKAYTSRTLGTAYVAFTAPSSDGNSPISSYKATSNPAGKTGTFTDKVGSGIITVTGLTNGSTYTFTVTATNAYGTGTASATSNPVKLDTISHTGSFKIIAVSDPTISTHQLTSGNFTIGLTNLGGGVINQLNIPGIGDIMDVETKKYGRCGQSAIRDRAHGGVYNPTQAGFNEALGTVCQLDQTPGKIVIQPRGVSLWHGDGNYDFTRWENIGPDPYTENTLFGGALNASDQDGIDEENIAVDVNGVVYAKQEAEVYSEWDYYGTYEDYMGKNGISTPAFRHYFEFRFDRAPGHSINQFRAGNLLWSPANLRTSIPHVNPAGLFAGTDKDMNTMLTGWALRHDRSKWTPQFSYFRNTDASWVVSPADSTALPSMNDGTVLILSDSNNPDAGHALGLYRPQTEINQYPVVGVNENTGMIVYKDDRQVFVADSARITKTMFRIPMMSLYGFSQQISGMINRTRLAPNVYEALRSEQFIFSGTTNQIKAAIAAYDANISTVTADISKGYGDDFRILNDPANGSFVVKLNENKSATIRIYNLLGKMIYSAISKTNSFSIHENEIGTKGVFLVEVNGVTKKAILL